METEAEGDDREPGLPPWEEPGSFRRDCEPERGTLLNRVASVGVILGVFAIFATLHCLASIVVASTVGLPNQRHIPSMTFVVTGAIVGLSNLVVFLPSIVSCYLARADLREIEAGQRDPSGKRMTHSAYQMAWVMSVLTGAGVAVGMSTLAFGAIWL